MAYNVFISFRFADGNVYKKKLAEVLDNSEIAYDVSEDKDRSNMTDDTIKQYLYSKLRNSSVIIVLLTPQALGYSYGEGKYNDWLYDELRYALEDREDNRTKGVIAVYTDTAENSIITKSTHTCHKCNEKSEVNIINDFNNLVRKNMMNIKETYKNNKCISIYDSNYDSYASLISFDEFINKVEHYISIAVEKKENTYKYNLIKSL